MAQLALGARQPMSTVRNVASSRGIDVVAWALRLVIADRLRVLGVGPPESLTRGPATGGSGAARAGRRCEAERVLSAAGGRPGVVLRTGAFRDRSHPDATAVGVGGPPGWRRPRA